MNEELQKVLIEMLNKASSGIDATKTFLEAEIPEVVVQLLLWHSVKSFLFFVLGILLSIPFVMLNRWVMKNSKEWNDNNDGEMHFFLAANILALIPLIMIFENLEWLQIWLAPKIFIIEYIASLAK